MRSVLISQFRSLPFATRVNSITARSEVCVCAYSFPCLAVPGYAGYVRPGYDRYCGPGSRGPRASLAPPPSRTRSECVAPRRKMETAIFVTYSDLEKRIQEKRSKFYDKRPCE